LKPNNRRKCWRKVDGQKGYGVWVERGLSKKGGALGGKYRTNISTQLA